MSAMENFGNVFSEIMKGFLVEETKIFKHEGQWKEITDFWEFVFKVVETRFKLGHVCLYTVERENVVWLHAWDNIYYYIRVDDSMKKPATYIQ